MKTLEEAIGCWTVNREYNSLPRLAKMVSEAARWCRASTLHSKNPQLLKRDLDILRARLETMMETTLSAQARLTQIIKTEELTA